MFKDNKIIALATNQKGPTYLIKYDIKDDKVKCTESEIIHSRASSSLGINNEGT